MGVKYGHHNSLCGVPVAILRAVHGLFLSGQNPRGFGVGSDPVRGDQLELVLREQRTRAVAL
jgi:hypothetical protein